MRGPLDSDILEAQRKSFVGIDWKRVLSSLVRFALSLGASPASARDTAYELIARLLAGEIPWDPRKDPDVMPFLLARIRRALSDERKSARHRVEVLGSMRADAADSPMDATAPSTPRAVAERREDEALARLRARLAQDPVALGIVALTLDEGIDKPAKQAARLGVPIETVYDARERIAGHTKRLAKEYARGQDKDVAQ